MSRVYANSMVDKKKNNMHQKTNNIYQELYIAYPYAPVEAAVIEEWLSTDLVLVG